MAFLFRLPLMLLELLLRRLFGRDDDHTDYAPPVREPSAPATAPTAAPEPAPPTADEALARSADRAAAQRANPHPGPPTPLRPIDGNASHLDTSAEPVASFGDPADVGATLTVDEPWPGYDGERAPAIVARLQDADPATRGVVSLYEQTHKRRKSVLRAAS